MAKQVISLLLTGWSLVRIRPGEPALSRTYAQYFDFFVLKPRPLDTPSFKLPIAFGVSLSRKAAQAFLLKKPPTPAAAKPSLAVRRVRLR